MFYKRNRKARYKGSSESRRFLRRAPEQKSRPDAILQALPGLFAELGPDARLRAYQSKGLPPELTDLDAGHGEPPETWLPPDMAALVRKLIAQQAAMPPNPGICFRSPADGTAMWLHFSIETLPAPAGSDEAGHLLIVRDVTDDYRRTHEAEQLGLVARHTTNPVVLIDINGRISWVNSATEEKSGYSLAELIGKVPYHVFRGPNTELATLRAIDREMRAGRNIRTEIELYDKSGRAYWVEIDAHPIHDAAGQVTSYMSIQTDVSKKNRQLSDLRRSEDQARNEKSEAMDASRDGISIIDPEGRCTYMNPAQLGMFGLTDEADILGEAWTSLHPAKTVQYLSDTVMPHLKAHGSWTGDLTSMHADGTTIHQEVSLTLKADGGLICISRDISERLQLEAARTRLNEVLQRAQRQEIVAQIAAGMAHDFSNMIASIAGSATFILERPDGDVIGHAERIMIAAENSTKLIQRFLNFGIRQAQSEETDVPKILSEAADLLKPSLNSSIRVTTDYRPCRIPLRIDPTDFLQVVMNLAINARDAMSPDHPNPEIHIAYHCETDDCYDALPVFGYVDRKRRYACLEVTDNGAGIDDAALPRIFEPYFTTKGERGTGLGLVVVSSVVDAYLGAILIDTKKNEGTRIRVLWPLDERASA